MKNATTRLLLAAAAAASLFATTGARAGDDAGVTRAQVRAELAEARASGMLDRFGEIATPEPVLYARDIHNQTEALVLAARYDYEVHGLAEQQAGTGAMPELASYVEAGSDGPLLVVVIYDGDGALRSADTVALAAID